MKKIDLRKLQHEETKLCAQHLGENYIWLVQVIPGGEQHETKIVGVDLQNDVVKLESGSWIEPLWLDGSKKLEFVCEI